MERKSKSYLTIAHISDLHTPTQGVVPRRRLVDFTVPLIDDLLRNKVDVLVVTGDVVDSPITSKIGVIKSYFEARETQILIDSLAATLASARTTLEQICHAASIDIDNGLCVIPGNHDLRIQGVLTGNNAYEQDASATFEEIFARYYRTRRLRSIFQNGAAIHATIVPFNSNTNQAVVNFSSGGITGQELRKFDEFFRTDKTVDSLPDSTFKICLVHHHPLPVGTAERPESLKKQREGGMRVAIRLVLGEVDDLDGVQTNAFRNAGVFLSYADSAGVDIILHGHQHRSWYSHLSYPYRDGERDEKKMLVAGASSVAEMSPNQTVSYNLLRLGRDRNIHLEERTLAINCAGNFGSGKRYKLYGTRELRGARHREMANSLQNSKTTPSGATFGVARARGVNRLFAIDDTSGDAAITLSIDGLQPGGDELERLPLMTNRYSSIDVVKPSVEVMGIGPKPSVRFAPVARSFDGGGDKIVWELQFEPPLEKGQEISLKISYVMKGVVSFSRDVDSSDWKDNEYVYYTCATVFPERLTLLVQFPRDWRPAQPPIVMARRGEEVDNEESRSLANTFIYQAVAGLALFSTDLPMPGISYGIEWQIDYARSLPVGG